MQAMQLVTDKDLMESVFALSQPERSLYESNRGATLIIQIEQYFAGNSLCNLHASLTSWLQVDCILCTNGNVYVQFSIIYSGK